MTTQSSKALESPWSLWLERDDRTLLENCSKESWDPSYCLETLREILTHIVTSVHFSGYSRWGVQPSKSSLESLHREFLQFLKVEGEWRALQKRWNSDQEGPYSLPLFLTRAYARFKEKHHPDTREERGTHSGLRGLLELPLPESALSSQLSGPILDVFVSMTHQLPEECRLVYQLHLEGLLDHEIAHLLRLDLGEVRERVRDAKSHLDLNAPRKGVGT